MNKKYYFDTSIWLDFFENRDEANLPKGQWAHKLLNKIIKDDDKIVYSDNNLVELNLSNYDIDYINQILQPFRPVLIFVESTKKQIGKAKDFSAKRNIPKRDVLHALIARDNKAILVTLDKHFQKITDITQPKKPQDLI